MDWSSSIAVGVLSFTFTGKKVNELLASCLDRGCCWLLEMKEYHSHWLLLLLLSVSMKNRP
jgi:hypothetical protein